MYLPTQGQHADILTKLKENMQTGNETHIFSNLRGSFGNEHLMFIIFPSSSVNV